MGKVTVTITSTRGIMHLVKNSAGREMSVDENKLIAAIDPDGRHLLYMTKPVDDTVIRTQWFVKLLGDEEPTPIWLDIDIDKIQEVGTVIELDVTEDH